MTLLLLAFVSAGARAADDFGFGGGGELKAGFSAMQNGDLLGRGRDRYDRTLDLSASMPVYAVKSDTSFIKYSLTASLGAQDEQLSIVPRALRLYDARVTAGAAIINDASREMYMLRVGVGIAEEQDSLPDAHERLSVFWMGTHHSRPDLTYLYGAGYSYIFGRGQLFPAFGLNWKIDEKRELNFILPIQARYSCKVSPVLKASLYSALFGNEYRFKNQGLYPGYSDTLYLHTVGFKLGTGVEYKAFPGWTLGADIATVLRRDVKISADSNDDLAQERTSGDFSFQLSCKWSFGRNNPTTGRIRG